jgi:hypothetical protein
VTGVQTCALPIWASQHLSDLAIQEYDSVMENGDEDLIYQYVNQLVEMYNESDYE